MIPTLEKECKQYLIASQGNPLLKYLPSHADGFRKVKVRKKKQQDNYIQSFNNAFFNEHEDLALRSIYANGLTSFDDSANTIAEPFYIFPIDGYKFMYSSEVSSSSLHYKETFEKLLEKIGNNGVNIFIDLLKYNYTFENLENGIKTGAEIIIYNIPYYYAIRKSLVENYHSFIYEE